MPENLTELPDRALIKRIVAGETEPFEVLVERYTAKAFQIAYGILGDRHDAEEVTQDSFVRIYKALPKFRGDSEFSTWMYRIVVNQARNRYRWNKRRGAGKNVPIADSVTELEDNPGMALEIADRDEVMPDKQLIYREWQSEIAHHMAELPDIHREILILRNIKNFSYDQIAEILGCKVGTVKSRIARAREELRKRLEM